jgi:hypothetical protein
MAFVAPFFMSIGAAASGAGAAAAGAAATLTPFAAVAGTTLFATSMLAGGGKPKSQTSMLPTTPSPADSLQKAQEDALNRMRMIAATGGQTSYAGMGSAGIDPAAIQRKTLLGN